MQPDPFITFEGFAVINKKAVGLLRNQVQSFIKRGTGFRDADGFSSNGPCEKAVIAGERKNNALKIQAYLRKCLETDLRNLILL